MFAFSIMLPGYFCCTNVQVNEPFLKDGSQTVLHVESLGHTLHAYVNGKLAGSGKGNSDNAKVSTDVPITLIPRKNKIDLLCLTVGLQTGLKGEELGLSNGRSSAWVSGATLPKEQPFIWYKTTFDTPSGTIPVALDFTGMGKGEALVNWQSIGRYWPTYIAPSSGCTDSCNYKGSYSSNKCLKNYGKPYQQL
ncbi:hypothetical protein RHMOL_Rhmol01G0087900 [Rhododendron molle]|uniref:Uncharacterized protein n=1 Tax=Rhododendron molle TaxID=49168 RepID=A0ACC0Q2F3_RHOML|nr:hypothetical protein RHMOL_Rhmol01G0087900 [Rhododendron molle]